MNYISEIIDILLEEGLEINYTGNDLDLRDYISDSIQFISFIVEVENRFQIEIPDEFLLYNSISSLHSFSKIIKGCVEDKDIAHNN